jgi:hypothetical protein
MRKHRLYSDDPWEQFNIMLSDVRSGLDELCELLKEMENNVEELQNMFDELREEK